MAVRSTLLVAIGASVFASAAPVTLPGQRTRIEVQIAGLCSGGEATFEVHHSKGVLRASRSLHGFEPPSITAIDMANALKLVAPAGWTVGTDFESIVLTLPPGTRLRDTRVCEGSGPCPSSASLRSPQVVRGQTWTQSVRRPKVRRLPPREITIDGLSAGGPITFELRHTAGVSRLRTTLGFFEPPEISALMVAGQLAPLLPAGWSISASGPRLVVTPKGSTVLKDMRIDEGFVVCPPSTSLTSPQLVAGQVWSTDVGFVDRGL